MLAFEVRNIGGGHLTEEIWDRCTDMKKNIYDYYSDTLMHYLDPESKEA